MTHPKKKPSTDAHSIQRIHLDAAVPTVYPNAAIVLLPISLIGISRCSASSKSAAAYHFQQETTPIATDHHVLQAAGRSKRSVIAHTNGLTEGQHAYLCNWRRSGSPANQKGNLE